MRVDFLLVVRYSNILSFNETYQPSFGVVNVSTRENASTFAKGLRVLECFESGQRGMTMADVARLCDFDRATARRLCLTLIDCGYLVQNGRALELTAKALAIGAGYLTSHDYGRAVQPILDRFAEELDGEIALAVLDGPRELYVARSDTSSARVSFGFSAGSTLPLAPTAIGRMLLAQLAPDALDARLAGIDLQRYTDRTETDPTELRARIRETAANGHCHVENEFEMGASALAVPVGQIGGVPAALGTTASVNAMDDPATRNRVLDILRRAAMGLGYQRGMGTGA